MAGKRMVIEEEYSDWINEINHEDFVARIFAEHDHEVEMENKNVAEEVELFLEDFGEDI